MSSYTSPLTTQGTTYAYSWMATINTRWCGYRSRFGCGWFATRPPASIAATISSKPIPRSRWSVTFLSAFHVTSIFSPYRSDHLLAIQIMAILRPFPLRFPCPRRAQALVVGSEDRRGSRVAYLLGADNVLTPLPIRLCRVNQTVLRSRIGCSAPREVLLDCLEACRSRAVPREARQLPPSQKAGASFCLGFRGDVRSVLGCAWKIEKGGEENTPAF